MIVFEQVSKKFSDKSFAVKNVSFQVKKGETLVLLGTSGCGKTTTMKMINRLIAPTSGNIFIDGKDIMQIDPVELRRSIGYAVQHVGLFNHMSIAENISIVPKLLGWDKEKINKRVDELLHLMEFSPEKVKNLYPKNLSGGQRQRIGVARALAADPPIILMDEPFGALDPITREQIQNEFIDLESDFEKTVVFVTHDLFEAMKMGDRIVLMDKGEILQIGSPRDLVDNPKNAIVEQFMSKHKFQLSLMTRPIKDFIENSYSMPDGKIEEKLSTKSTIIDALDIFKKTSNKAKLPVFKGKKFVGYLPKKKLYSAVLEVLQELGEGE